MAAVDTRPLLVAALGGNALMPPDAALDDAARHDILRRTAATLARLARSHRLVVTHGNGPQIGLLARQAAAAAGFPYFPLDVLGAESDALIGYALARELGNADADLPACCVLTQIEVGADDPAFANPTKPIGPVLAAIDAEAQARAHGWTMAADRGGMRRVVPSPAPRRIVELPAIAALVAAGVVTICCGGGGIPVAAGPDGRVGIEAVIDKDAASALLAIELGARRLVLLTDVESVRTAWPDGRIIRRATPEGLAGLDFPAGSMGPKVAAAARFAAATGGTAHIGHLAQAGAVTAGEAGTAVARDGPPLVLDGSGGA